MLGTASPARARAVGNRSFSTTAFDTAGAMVWQARSDVMRLLWLLSVFIAWICKLTNEVRHDTGVKHSVHEDAQSE